MLPDSKQANQQNAQKSTGPRTDAGKSRASLNALKHGCSAQTVILPGEDAQHFQRFHASYVTDLLPIGALETGLVQTLAESQWSINRIRAHETNLFAMGHETYAGQFTAEEPIQTALAAVLTFRDELNTLKTISLYLQRATRLFQITLKQLREIQTTRKLAEAEEFHQAALITEIHLEAGIPINLNDYGFVCSPAAVELHLRRKNARQHPYQPTPPMTKAA
jgi:hypothetical protein